MNSLKELINHIIISLQDLDITDPLLKDPDYISGELQISALEKIPLYLADDSLQEFLDVSENSFRESTFKQFIPNYPDFLRSLESDFWASILVGDLELVD